MLNIIEKINQVILLVAGLLVIFTIGKELIDKLKPSRPYESPKVAIEQPTNNEETIKEKVETNFLLELKGVYLFSLESETIDPTQARYADTRVAEFRIPSSHYARDQMINIIFLKEDGSKTVLLDKDALIGEFKPARFESNEMGDIFGSNIYHIATDDTNNDGYLSEKDMFSIYISNYDGSDLRKLISNVSRSFVLKDNILIIRTGTKYNSKFYTYNLLENSLIELDTSTQLTEQSKQVTNIQ